MLFAMGNVYFYAELVVQVFGQVLGTIDRAVLTTRASEGEHQVKPRWR